MRKITTALFITAVSVSLFASFSHAQDVYTDNVVIVLDDSGSMDESMRDAKGNKIQKMAAAKTALYEVLKQIPDTTQVGLVTFGSNWIYPLGPKNDVKLRAAIDSIRPSGGTPLGQFIKVGGDELLKEREKQYGYGSYRLLIVTDGKAGDEGEVNRYTPDLISRGINLDVIGVDMRDRHMLANLAHSYRAANDPESLTQAVQEVFAEVRDASSGAADTSEEIFAELVAIPNEIAIAMIQTLSDTGNHPIGTKPQPRVTAETSNQPASPTTQVQQPVQQDEEFPCIIWILIIIVIVVIAGVGISVMGRC